MTELEINNLNELLNFDNIKEKYIINKLLDSHSHIFINNKNSIDITKKVYDDTNIEKWGHNLPTLKGSKELLIRLLNNPINNIDILKSRQKAYVSNFDSVSFDILKDFENDILWTYKLDDDITNDNAINLLFPQNFLYKFINNHHVLLDIFHIYKIAFIPFTSIFYPLTSIFAPYFYVNNYLKLNISLSSYFKLIKEFILLFFKFTGNIKIDLLKIIFFFIYLFLYLYSIYQIFEYSIMLFKTKKNLHIKMQGIINFVNESNKIINDFSLNDSQHNILSPFISKFYKPSDLSLTNSMTTIYNIWKNNNIKNNINNLLITIYTYDIINSISKLKFYLPYSYAIYDNISSTKLWNMKNPLLDNKQISNPIDLHKNIIITGPNAAGKTTYVKSILSNVILSQTFGIVYATKSSMQIYDCIYSFMRISDEIGVNSYFEAEAELCSDMIEKAAFISKENKKALFLMDEPMHSTPPTEGIATAYAVAENIGTIPNINIIITTHFFKLTSLEKNYPNNFINLCVEAIENKDNFIFPYKIKKGSSTQCIAIELLKYKKFPLSVINSAKNIKKIICKHSLDS
jgi:hypothetical protein